MATLRSMKKRIVDRDFGTLTRQLGYQGPKTAVRPSAIAARKWSYYERCQAAAALGRIGDPVAITALTTALTSDEHWLVRLTAADALIAVGDAESSPILTKAIGSVGTEAAIEGLVRLGTMRDLELLEPLALVGSRQAIWAILEAGPPWRPNLTSAFDNLDATAEGTGDGEKNPYVLAHANGLVSYLAAQHRVLSDRYGVRHREWMGWGEQVNSLSGRRIEPVTCWVGNNGAHLGSWISAFFLDNKKFTQNLFRDHSTYIDATDVIDTE